MLGPSFFFVYTNGLVISNAYIGAHSLLVSHMVLCWVLHFTSLYNLLGSHVKCSHCSTLYVGILQASVLGPSFYLFVLRTLLHVKGDFNKTDNKLSPLAAVGKNQQRTNLTASTDGKLYRVRKKINLCKQNMKIAESTMNI